MKITAITGAHGTTIVDAIAVDATLAMAAAVSTPGTATTAAGTGSGGSLFL